MTCRKDQVQSVKAEVSSGCLSQHTVDTLRHLLNRDASPASSGTAAKSKTIRPTRTGNARPRAPEPVTVHEDGPFKLSQREKFALATETVNGCLKLLTASVNSRIDGSPDTVTPRASRESPALSRRVLQARSANASPGQTSQCATKGSRKDPSTSTDAELSRVVTTIAECARLCFAFLRSVDTQKLGTRSIAPLQLEKGMLSLASNLLKHGLPNLAARELVCIKQRLQEFGREPSAYPKPIYSAQKQTVVSLLHLDIALDAGVDLLQLAVRYQQNVLRLILSSRKVAQYEELLTYLSPDSTTSPSTLIMRMNTKTGDQERATQQLEALSRSIFMLCNNTAPSADEFTLDPSQSACPSVVLKLQVIALRIRKLWWTGAGHEPDLEKELLGPLLNCLTAFLSRTSEHDDPLGTYNLVYEAVSTPDLGVLDAISYDTTIDIENILYLAAANAQLQEIAAKWAKSMLIKCQHRGTHDARHLTQLARHLSLDIGSNSCSEHSRQRSKDLQIGLQGIVTGRASDYTQLLAALSEMSNKLLSSETIEIPDRMHLADLSAGFALRYSRSYPGQNTTHVEAVLAFALHSSQSIDDMQRWITVEAAKFFIRAQVLDVVTQVASTKPLAAAWCASPSAISLSRILKALILFKLRDESSSDEVIDDDTLSDAARGVLLEVQLKYAADFATKPKYGPTLSRLLPNLLAKLDIVFTKITFPLRRARVALAVIRLHEVNPQILSQETLQTWDIDYDLDGQALGKDGDLRGFVSDIKAAIDVARTFAGRRPQLSCIETSIAAWRQIVDQCCTKESLHARVDNVESLITLLKATASYLSAIGEEFTCLATMIVLRKLRIQAGASNNDLCDSTVELGFQYLRMGYAERAHEILHDRDYLLHKTDLSRLTTLKHTLAEAECLLAFSRFQELTAIFERLREEEESLNPDTVPREQKREYERLHALCWLLYSQYMFCIGISQAGLRSAKVALRILNSVWASLERTTGISNDTAVIGQPEIVDAELSKLSKGISKLKLTSHAGGWARRTGTLQKYGPKFWPFLPLLMKALLHLSEAYVFHGLYGDADYYSNRALGIAELMGGSRTTTRVRSHRAQILILAGRVQDAELCLSQDDQVNLSEPSIAAVDTLKAQAAISTREGLLEEAATLYGRAEQMLFTLQSQNSTYGSEILPDIRRGTVQEKVISELAHRPRTRVSPSEATGRTTRNLRTHPTSTDLPRQTKKTSQRKFGTEKCLNQYTPSACILMSQRRAEIMLLKALILVKLGRDIGSALTDLKQMDLNGLITALRRQTDHTIVMRRALAASELDITFNALSESILSCPALARYDAVAPQGKVDFDSTGSQFLVGTKVKNKKISEESRLRPKNKVGESCECLFEAANKTLKDEYTAFFQSTGIVQTHLESSLFTNSSFLLSAVSPSFARSMQSIDRSLIIDLPRVRALHLEKQATIVDTFSSKDLDALGWPSGIELDSSLAASSGSEFQEQYIDVMPQAWTAVSLCLNLDRTELYVARYRAGESPLVLRIPFSRHESEGLEIDKEIFGFDQGKAELQDIIQLSDNSCHNSDGTDTRAGKQKWWAARQSLDNRLHELLINIENIWFGGFKGVLSTQKINPVAFQQFRQSFEDLLDRHLPARQAAKRQTQKLMLDDKLLELFVGLGDDNNGQINLDESILDLLYFAVDTLQYGGECNAHDEIDYDALAVEALDALRTYHNQAAEMSGGSQHLVLVLDRRVQCFPWENMPYLQNTSVSRVGSMLSLRECIMAARQQKNLAHSASTDEMRFSVTRESGSYFLNPSSDLKSTEATLTPALETLETAPSNQWSSIVGRTPSEKEFSQALENKSIVLYFGHGAGTQYIGTRTIKRLPQCSEVVWLMGCSSGAVTEHGDLEPVAVPLAYLLAGQTRDKATKNGRNERLDGHPSTGKCLAVVANLWDVTDKDIDRFSLSVGEAWGLWPHTETSKLNPMVQDGGKRREVVAVPSTPVQANKLPKTPKAHKTPAPAKTPARRKAPMKKIGVGKQSLAQAVAESRDVCYLRYLNGAAPVVFGIPVYLSD